MIGPLNFFQVREDCDQFRIANGTSLLLCHHKGHIATTRTRVVSLGDFHSQRESMIFGSLQA